ncbi:hypothetical protein, partial [Pumilibacter muris]|uniref:hypothetical protein n=1 Tax=Pumilibacter muris TaxID=2941510 RepID=UPI00203E424F
ALITLCGVKASRFLGCVQKSTRPSKNACFSCIARDCALKIKKAHSSRSAASRHRVFSVAYKRVRARRKAVAFLLLQLLAMQPKNGKCDALVMQKIGG